MNLSLAGLMAGILLLSQVVPCLAQNSGLKSFDNKGTLVSVGNYQVVFKTKDGKEYTAYLDEQKSTFTYRGTAEPNALIPGLLVRFTGKFDNNGNPQSEQKEIEVFTPRIGQRMSQKDILAQTPGIYPTQEPEANAPANPTNPPAGRSNPKDSKSKNGKDKTKSDPKAKGGDFVEYRVVAQVVNVQGTKLQLSTGAQMLMVQLANGAKVSINTQTPNYCAKGDEVQVVGLASAELPTAIQAQTVNVTGAKPVGKSDMSNQTDKNAAASNSKPKTDSKKTDDKKGSGDKKQGDRPGPPK